MKRALVRRPSSALARCQRTFAPLQHIDHELALEQHHLYVLALQELGLAVEVLPPLEMLADSCFLEDPALALPESIVLFPMGTPARQPEVGHLESELAKGEQVKHITDGRIEGGDCLVIGRDIYVGLSSRTDTAGISALRKIVSEWDYQVHEVLVEGCLHLKSGCSALDENTFLINPDYIQPRVFHRQRLLKVDPREPLGANVLRIANTVLVSESFPRTRDLLEAAGYKTKCLNITEFEKAEAGLTCLSLIYSDQR